MGLIISKFHSTRTDLNAYGTLLDQLESELIRVSKQRTEHQQNQRAVIRSLILYSTAIWVIIVAIIYAADPRIPGGKNQTENKILQVAPILLFPAAVYLLKQLIDSYYSRAIKSDEKMLIKLEKKKQSMLEDLVRDPVFTKTRDLLNKYHQPKAAPQPQTTATITATPAKQPNSRPNNNTTTPSKPINSNNTVGATPATAKLSAPGSIGPVSLVPGQPYVSAAQAAELSRAALVPLSHTRSPVDKVIDFVLGDGPNNRYALICKQCYTHNGLAPPDEVNIRFRCVHCNFINGPALEKDWKPVILPGPTLTTPMATTAAAAAIAATPIGSTASTSHPSTPRTALSRRQSAPAVDDGVDDSLLFGSTETKKPSTSSSPSAPISRSTSTSTSSSRTTSPVSEEKEDVKQVKNEQLLHERKSTAAGTVSAVSVPLVHEGRKHTEVTKTTSDVGDRKTVADADDVPDDENAAAE